MGRINIEIPDEIHRRIKSASALRKTTLIEYINTAVRERLVRMGRWKEGSDSHGKNQHRARR